jgi:hypothetical protein
MQISQKYLTQKGLVEWLKSLEHMVGLGKKGF